MAFLDWWERLDALGSRVFARLARGSFATCGEGRIHPTARIQNPRLIKLGNGFRIGRHAWLYAVDHDGTGQRYTPEFSIGDGVRIGDFCHITCAERLSIGANVLMGRNVLVQDAIHVFEDLARPIAQQGLELRPTSIGENCWLGNNAVIIGCSVGRHCVISANAVVTKDVPDYCVVGGVPARILKRYDAAQRAWVRVEGETARLGQVANAGEAGVPRSR